MILRVEYQDRKLVKTLSEHLMSVRSLAIDARGRVWSADVSGVVYIWDGSKLKLDAKPRLHWLTDAEHAAVREFVRKLRKRPAKP